VQDLERILNLLKGNLDPELTKFDEISPTVEEVDPVPTSSLSLHPGIQGTLENRFETLLPVQSLAVENGSTDGEDQLVVSATATGKTLVGEMAGIDRVLNGEGKMLFLVPLVALANQKYEEFQEEYGDIVDVSLRVGASRINDSGNRFDPSADVIVGTYEGIDHALRTGRDLGDVGTVVIDEVHTLGEGERGHRLDGLISRLKYYCRQASGDTQWIYLSATVGNPETLAAALEATLIEFEERPVPIERHVTFLDGREKVDVENKLVRRAYDQKSSKGYRGQTIIFTNSRRRCHQISRKLEYSSAPYHAGLDNNRRTRVEQQFADQELAAVVTTAALAAGVDFPASQVVFDSLAMGIEWLSVQEFHQMLGRAGRPDYHDKGTVYLLVEPDGAYHNSQEMTEDEVAFKLLKGRMEPVQTRYDEAAAVEETLANVTVGGSHAKALNESMVGEVPTKHALGKLLEYNFIDGLAPTPLGRAVTEHFLSPGDAFALLDGIRQGETESGRGRLRTTWSHKWNSETEKTDYGGPVGALLVDVVQSLGHVHVLLCDAAGVVGRQSDLDLAPRDRDFGVVEGVLCHAASTRREADAAEVGVELEGPDNFVALAGPAVGKLCLNFVVGEHVGHAVTDSERTFKTVWAGG